MSIISDILKEPKFVPFLLAFFHYAECDGDVCETSWLFHHIQKMMAKCVELHSFRGLYACIRLGVIGNEYIFST